MQAGRKTSGKAISFNKSIPLKSLRHKISHRVFILVLNIISLLSYWTVKIIGSGEKHPITLQFSMILETNLNYNPNLKLQALVQIIFI